jgi:hypothetical protein
MTLSLKNNINIPVFRIRIRIRPCVLGLTDTHPDPLVRGTADSSIRIRTKMSRIPNTGKNYENCNKMYQQIFVLFHIITFIHNVLQNTKDKYFQYYMWLYFWWQNWGHILGGHGTKPWHFSAPWDGPVEGSLPFHVQYSHVCSQLHQRLCLTSQSILAIYGPMVLMRADPIPGQVGGVTTWKLRLFGPCEMASSC